MPGSDKKGGGNKEKSIVQRKNFQVLSPKRFTRRDSGLFGEGSLGRCKRGTINKARVFLKFRGLRLGIESRFLQSLH